VGKVGVGFFSFTEITDPAKHRAYNEWHQLDHMPEQFPLEGVVYGQRWVSTPDCRRARAVDSETFAPVHYMTLYLMGEPVDRTLGEFADLGGQLREAGRFFSDRRAHVSGPLALRSTAAAPRVLVSGEAVPYRPNRGVYVVVRAEDAAGPSGRAHDGAGPGGDLGAALLGEAGVAGVWTFGPDARLERHRWGFGSRTVTVCFLDDVPLEVADALGASVRAVAAELGQTIEFAGPFETITPWQWDWFEEVDT